MGHRRVARALLIIVTESTVAELPVVDNGLVSGVEAGVIRVEGEVRNKVVVVDEELVKLVELVGIVLDVDEVEVCRVSESLTEELEIEEDDELEAIKLESEETCGEGVGEEEELGDWSGGSTPERKIRSRVGTITVGIARGRCVIVIARSTAARQRARWHQRSAFEELNQDVEMIEAEEGDDVDDMFAV
ncbi:hypothetical protein EDB84DRAFT_1446259 [Lactarius hengduanensis]|nr:hypothetical protein EDB84DRAFT_1446259 [Lactarius hengduanensis]